METAHACLKKINIPNEFVTNPFSRESVVKIKGSNSDSASDSSGSSTSDKEGAASVSRRHLDFSTPSKQPSRLGGTYPFGLKSLQTEPVKPSKRVRKTAPSNSSVWEKYKF